MSTARNEKESKMRRAEVPTWHGVVSLLGLALGVLIQVQVASAQVVYSQDGAQDWVLDNGVWEVGTPMFGPGACSGSQLPATVLAGNYPMDTVSRLRTPSIDVLTVSTGRVVQAHTGGLS